MEMETMYQQLGVSPAVYQYGESGPYGRAVPCASETPPQRPGEMQGCGYHASPYPGDDKEESETSGSGRTSRDKKVK